MIKQTVSPKLIAIIFFYIGCGIVGYNASNLFCVLGLFLTHICLVCYIFIDLKDKINK